MFSGGTKKIKTEIERERERDGVKKGHLCNDNWFPFH